MIDLLTAPKCGLWDAWYRECRDISSDRALAVLRDEIVKQARAKWEAELAEVKRQAAWDALTKLKETIRWSDTPSLANAADSLKRQLQGMIDTHYAPTPRSVTLSDGSVVYLASGFETHGQCWLIRDTPAGPRKIVTLGQWPQLLRVTDTSADFAAIKAFAATVEKK